MSDVLFMSKTTPVAAKPWYGSNLGAMGLASRGMEAPERHGPSLARRPATLAFGHQPAASGQRPAATTSTQSIMIVITSKIMIMDGERQHREHRRHRQQQQPRAGGRRWQQAWQAQRREGSVGSPFRTSAPPTRRQGPAEIPASSEVCRHPMAGTAFSAKCPTATVGTARRPIAAAEAISI